MPEAGSGSVQLLEADPDLARGLDPRRVREVSQRLFVRTIDAPRGAWKPARALANGSQPIGLLVLEGLLVREATVGDHPSAELLGPGDLLRAWDDSEAEILLPRTVEWTALTPSRLAIIDQALAVRAAQWPEIFATLVERSARRAERLVVMQAIAHLTRVDDRLLALLWCLAERWGRVVPEGVLVSLRLPHRTLAGMVGARRPSVTTALGQLIASGAIQRRSDGSWLLRGDPPETRANGSRNSARSTSPRAARGSARRIAPRRRGTAPGSRPRRRRPPPAIRPRPGPCSRRRARPRGRRARSPRRSAGGRGRGPRGGRRVSAAATRSPLT